MIKLIGCTGYIYVILDIMLIVYSGVQYRVYLWPLLVTLLLKESSRNECIFFNFMAFLAMCSHLASTPKVHYHITTN